MEITEELSWKYHIHQIKSKISKVTGVLAKAENYVSQSFEGYLSHYGVFILIAISFGQARIKPGLSRHYF